MATAVVGNAAKALAGQIDHLVLQASALSGQPWLNTTGCPLPQSL